MEMKEQTALHAAHLSLMKYGLNEERELQPLPVVQTHDVYISLPPTLLLSFHSFSFFSFILRSAFLLSALVRNITPCLGSVSSFHTHAHT